MGAGYKTTLSVILILQSISSQEMVVGCETRIFYDFQKYLFVCQIFIGIPSQFQSTFAQDLYSKASLAVILLESEDPNESFLVSEKIDVILFHQTAISSAVFNFT